MQNLLNFNEALGIAFHTMGILSANPKMLIQAQTISKFLNVSEHHLQKVHQRLAKMGLIRAVRGPKGGFMLNRPAKKIRLLEIYEAIEGPLKPCQCVLGRPKCTSQDCVLGQLTNQVNDLVLTFLKKHTVGDLSHEGFVLPDKELAS